MAHTVSNVADDRKGVDSPRLSVPPALLGTWLPHR